jgi:uncharacterized protein (DUF1697 family)
MKTYIALLRGINVGGSNLLPMKALKHLLEKEGCVDVQTYIQSGNVIFHSAMSNPARLAKRLTVAISKGHGFAPRLLLLTRSELERAATGNPFPDAHANPTTLHLFFLAEEPKTPDLKPLDALRSKTERFELRGRIFYLHTPDGIGASKLAARAEKLLGVAATARNWRTVTTLLEMAKLREGAS